MMPPPAVWRIHPPEVVPYLLMWARSTLTSPGRMGMVRVSLAARCFEVLIKQLAHPGTD